MNIDHYNSGGIMVKWRISNTHNVSRDISQSMEDLEIEIVELQNLEASTGSRRAFWAPQVQKEDPEQMTC